MLFFIGGYLDVQSIWHYCRQLWPATCLEVREAGTSYCGTAMLRGTSGYALVHWQTETKSTARGHPAAAMDLASAWLPCLAATDTWRLAVGLCMPDHLQCFEVMSRAGCDALQLRSMARLAPPPAMFAVKFA
jgi:hypothetical protein